jgi:predicted XRE-type DNA-binding protein
MSEDVIESSGNVFVDLGFPPDEASILQMRADLMADLRKFIETRGLSPAKVVEMLSVGETVALDLLGGKWEEFSLEMLITLAVRAGLRVTLKTAA